MCVCSGLLGRELGQHKQPRNPLVGNHRSESMDTRMAAICGRGSCRLSGEAGAGSSGAAAKLAGATDECDVLEMDVFNVKAEVGNCKELGVCARSFGAVGARVWVSKECGRGGRCGRAGNGMKKWSDRRRANKGGRHTERTESPTRGSKLRKLLKCRMASSGNARTAGVHHAER